MMYTELRPAEGELATTPESWAANFRHSQAYSVKTWGSIRFDWRWRMIRNHLSGRLLDAGCGFGEWVEFLNRHGYEADGIDYSSELIQRLRVTYPHRKWIQGSTQHTGLPDASYGGIVSWGVIEHDPNGTLEALAEFRRIIVPGGRIFVTVPADNERMRSASQSQFPVGDKFFQFFFTPEELAEQLRSAGFSVLSSGDIPDNAPMLMAPSIASHLPVRLALRVLPFVRGCNGMIFAIGEKR